MTSSSADNETFVWEEVLPVLQEANRAAGQRRTAARCTLALWAFAYVLCFVYLCLAVEESRKGETLNGVAKFTSILSMLVLVLPILVVIHRTMTPAEQSAVDKFYGPCGSGSLGALPACALSNTSIGEEVADVLSFYRNDRAMAVSK